MVFHMPYFSWFRYLLAALFENLLENALTVLVKVTSKTFICYAAEKFVW